MWLSREGSQQRLTRTHSNSQTYLFLVAEFLGPRQVSLSLMVDLCVCAHIYIYVCIYIYNYITHIQKGYTKLWDPKADLLVGSAQGSGKGSRAAKEIANKQLQLKFWALPQKAHIL